MDSMPTRILRSLVGLLLVVAGLNKFLHFMPDPPHNEAATAFMTALVSSGYVMPLVAVVEVASGLAFLTGRFVALAAVVMAPVSINIVLFHAMIDPAESGPAFFVGFVNAWLLAVHMPKYQDLLVSR